MSKLHDLWLVLKGELTSSTVAEKQAEADSLAEIIRKYDDQLWQMGQHTSFEQMRPHFQFLLEIVKHHKELEHDRITSLMVPELERTYGR